MAPQLRVYVPPHPLLQHWLTVARDASTPASLFCTAVKELGRWLAYEAAREWLPLEDMTVQTPLGPCAARALNPDIPIAVIPILRAGLPLWEGAQTVLPVASVYHVGMERNEETLEARCYLNKLPPRLAPQTRAAVFDPMLATGNTLVSVLDELVERGADMGLVRIIAIVAAPPGLQKLGDRYPGTIVYAACIDEGLNERGFIVPGLGDAGDRAFGT